MLRSSPTPCRCTQPFRVSLILDIGSTTHQETTVRGHISSAPVIYSEHHRVCLLRNSSNSPNTCQHNRFSVCFTGNLYRYLGKIPVLHHLILTRWPWKLSGGFSPSRLIVFTSSVSILILLPVSQQIKDRNVVMSRLSGNSLTPIVPADRGHLSGTNMSARYRHKQIIVSGDTAELMSLHITRLHNVTISTY